MTSDARAAMVGPKAILAGVDGSAPRRLRKPKKPTTTGVRATTQNGLMDWKISAGITCSFWSPFGHSSFGRLSRYGLGSILSIGLPSGPISVGRNCASSLGPFSGSA